MRLFGKEGQERLGATRVALVGLGGLGSAIAQHLALLGVGELVLIDAEELDDTNRNRFIGAVESDPVPGSKKVRLVERMIRAINSDVVVTAIEDELLSEAAFAAIRSANWVLGCFDHDGPRAILNEVCAAYSKPFIDLASDVPEPGVYGGRICVMLGDSGCLHCLGLLDSNDVRRYMLSSEELTQEAAMYGVPLEALGDKGPSVSPVNGVVAALAATEFMAAVTGMRKPAVLLEYRGHVSKVTVRVDTPTDCPICRGSRGLGVKADVERYLKLRATRAKR